MQRKFPLVIYQVEVREHEEQIAYHPHTLCRDEPHLNQWNLQLEFNGIGPI